jgi:hypothetical protein
MARGLWPTRKQWRAWSLPSKFTAVGMYASIAGLLLTLIIQVSTGGWPFSARARSAAPTYVALELINSGQTAVGVFGRGDMAFWLPEGIGGGPRQVAGKYQLLETSAGVATPAVVTVPGRSRVAVLARLEDPEGTAALLEAGTTDLELVLRTTTGKMVFSGSIPFAEDQIEGTRWGVEIAAP